MSFPIQKTDAQWQEILRNKPQAEPLAWQVTRHAATERPFTGRYEQFWEKGRYHCIACEAPLFDSHTKFDAGCGWPSFDEALPGAIVQRPDDSHGMRRVEILCAQCGAHLGHVFPDGPTDTGLRYCMNSAAMDFEGGEGGQENPPGGFRP
ncbi:peptide-methionine (R)-S-oxide reductase [Corticibacter populi]|uniref:peptide-methionine (R)-S-oxide reductase n=1 Tax=Corticibacter populi TaxID=1550736 RepID=A0A3M6QZB5_9BURK|nr:peptide-methionine (R)-S-oxide reductase MsrB [Corticibacter populi]RMX08281.1 peptide-methionine (R)-S-oxide reductase [Corticibacter populi]RZS35560.1 peptide-methionine (R)-S-oxide reductase [Corticibacter populi]